MKKTYYPDWTCPECKFDNFGSRSECKQCGCFRSKASSNKLVNSGTKVGDWNCDCGELNFASRTACRKCNKNKNKLVNSGAKVGDWNCDCGELNFASRKACRKCNKTKHHTCSNAIHIDLTCPITLDYLEHPICLPCCGKAVSKVALLHHLECSKTCPLCRYNLSQFDAVNAVISKNLTDMVSAYHHPS